MTKFFAIAFISAFVFIGCSSKTTDRYGFDGESLTLYDKQEGTVWIYSVDGWVNLGTPPKDAPDKGDKSKVDF